jgi:hypothetical protein
MNSVLDDAEARIAPAAATAQTLQEERLDAMRMEIGRQHYERAKLELPKLEHFIATTAAHFWRGWSSVSEPRVRYLHRSGLIRRCGCDRCRTQSVPGSWLGHTHATDLDKWAGLISTNARAGLYHHVSLRTWMGYRASQNAPGQVSTSSRANGRPARSR